MASLAYGRIGAHNLGHLGATFYGAADTVPKAGLTAVHDFYGKGGYAYRAFSDSTGGTLAFQVLRGPAGTTTGLMRYSGTSYDAIRAEYTSGKTAWLNPYAISMGTSQGAGGSGGSSGKPPAGTQAVDNSGTSWLDAFTQVATAVTPLVGGVVTAVQAGGPMGGGGSPAEIAGLIAKKQAQLAKTTDQVKRAKLAAEIKQLQTQQTMLAQSTAAGLADTQGSYQGGGGSGGVSTTPPWLWPVVITGGLLLVGGGALILSRK
jgi:hypothetical protein